jgi:hypothetical protein
MVTKASHRSFVYQYRAGHQSRRMTFPIDLGLDRARKEAAKHWAAWLPAAIPSRNGAGPSSLSKIVFTRSARNIYVVRASGSGAGTRSSRH